METSTTTPADAAARAAGLYDRLAEPRAVLERHPLHAAITDLPALRRLAGFHVFAVWDFMQLLKGLQAELAPARVPWTPSPARRSAGFVNELVLGEESDEDPRGGRISHFELYLDGMREIDAPTGPIEGYLARLADGADAVAALEAPDVPPAARTFTATTLGFARSGSLPALAGAFCLGREAIIPSLFTRLLEGAYDAPLLRYYFERHVELDGGSHGELARALLIDACGTSDAAWREAELAARASLDARGALWDAVLGVVRP